MSEKGGGLLAPRHRAQGYLAHEKTPLHPRTPYSHKHRPTVGSYGVALISEVLLCTLYPKPRIRDAYAAGNPFSVTIPPTI